MTGNRILVVEDHTIVRKSLTALLAATTDLEVVAEAADGHEAIQQARLHNPDIVLMDLSMPHTSGVEALRAIKQRDPRIKVIILTLHKAEEYVRATLQAGADGYVLKDDTQHDLLAAIASVQKGKAFLSPGISDKVIGGFLNRDRSGPGGTSWDILTSREQEVLILIAEGKKNREIASYLSVSPKTVEKHRTSLMNKLNLHNVALLTSYAIEHGLVSH